MQFETFAISVLVLMVLTLGLVLSGRTRTYAVIAAQSLTVALLVMGIAFLLFQYQKISLHALMAASLLFASIAAGIHLVVSLLFAQRRNWLRPSLFGSLLIVPALIQILYWIDSLATIFFHPPLPIGVWMNSIYALGILGVSCALLVAPLLRRPRDTRAHRYLAIGAALLPMFAALGTVVRLDTVSTSLVLLASYALYLIAVANDLFEPRPLERDQITRDTVVEGMDDGWMVVDDQDIIVDLNRATEEMIGLPREKVYGQPIHTILSDWQNMFTSPQGLKELDVRRSVKSKSDWRYLNIRVSKLSDSNNINFGHLIVWRDITTRKLVDDARQHARDELFVLLNAISSAASQSMSLEEFLNESIYQIVYSFRSQAVAVYLIDENLSENGLAPLALKAQFGIPPEHVETMSDSPLTTSILQWLQSEHARQSLEVVDLHGDDLEAYAVVQQMGFARMAMIPLTVVAHQKSELLGCICLTRSEDVPFTQDEIIRLKTISNQIATLIDSDRRRQFAIATSERQRLMRDLHDSVSQKLYGLLALTEAAQAALEAGQEIIPTQVLSRIGENARQAVREMRLFLYEMQPVDLEEGLVSVLHHRLAAVEGRADIKARLVVDENMALPKDKEIALYFISQEALNNILRHAHAKNVSISLKQTRQNVILEVDDDGLGFDMELVDRGGLGLRNMRERTLKMDGKFKIQSKPGDGTKISVVLPRKS